MIRRDIACAAAGLVAMAGVSPSMAQSTVSTQFNTSDGFVTGGTVPVSIASGAFSAEFSGGQQQQSFDGPSYNVGPAAYLFINGGGGFTGSFGGTAASTGDTGDVTFSQGATEVSVFVANRAQGAATTVRVFGTDDTTVLAEIPVSQTDLRPSANPTPTVLSAEALGGLIGRVQFDNPGPAANPPYVTAIDTFSATRAGLWDESVNGDFSTDPLTPTAVDLQLGSNTIAGSVTSGPGADTRDYFTFTIEPGEFLAEILLLEYDDPNTAGVNDGNRGFQALFEGDVAALPAFGNNLGGNHLDPLAFGTDLLPGLAGGGISGGTGIPGGVLGPGTYTYLIQQTGPQTSDYLVDLVVVPEPAAFSMLTLGALAALRRRRA